MISRYSVIIKLKDTFNLDFPKWKYSSHWVQSKKMFSNQERLQCFQNSKQITLNKDDDIAASH